MPLPSDLRVSRLITSFVGGYSNPKYIADQILPPVPVDRMEGKIRIWLANNLRLTQTLSDDKTVATDFEGGVTSGNYAIELHRKRTTVGFFETEEDDLSEAKQAAAEQVAELLMLRRENSMASMFFSSGNYPTANKGTASVVWSNYGSSTGVNSPIQQVQSAKYSVKLAAGVTPNIMAMTWDVWRYAIGHPSIKGDIASTIDKGVAAVNQRLSTLFGMDEVHVLDAVRLNSAEGATDVFSFLATDKVSLFHRAPGGATRRKPQFAVHLVRRGFPNGDQWVDEERMNSSVIEARYAYQWLPVMSAAAFLIDNTV